MRKVQGLAFFMCENMKYISYYILFLGILLNAGKPIFAQVKIEKWSNKDASEQAIEQNIQKGIDCIYNLEHQKASRIFETVIKSSEKSPVGYFFDGMVLWWKIMLNIENMEYDDAFKDKMEKVISVSDEILEREINNSTAIFYKAAALGFRGRLLANRGEWLNAAFDGKNALPLVGQLSKIDENNYDVQFGLGIYNYYAEAIPEKYPILKPFTVFFPKGDKIKAVKQLNAAAKNGKYARTEALYFLMQIYYSYERDYEKALKYASELNDKYPKNLLFKAYKGRIYSRLGNTLKVSEIYGELIEMLSQSHQKLYKKYLIESNYYIGLSFMLNRDYDDAISSYEKVLDLSDGLYENNKYLMMAMYNMGNIYKNKGEKEKALRLYEGILKKDNCCDDLHEKAIKKMNQLKK